MAKAKASIESTKPVRIMKNFLSVVLLFVIFTLPGQAQKLYSQKNLEQASREDLSLYLTKAQKLTKTGGFLSVAGPSLTTLSLLLMARENSAYSGLYLFLFGSGVTFIGIPMLLTGSSRILKISKVLNNKFHVAGIDVTPGISYNYQSQNIQPGITFRISF